MYIHVQLYIHPYEALFDATYIRISISFLHSSVKLADCNEQINNDLVILKDRVVCNIFINSF